MMCLFAFGQDSECVPGTHTFSFHDLLAVTQFFTHFSRCFTFFLETHKSLNLPRLFAPLRFENFLAPFFAVI